MRTSRICFMCEGEGRRPHPWHGDFPCLYCNSRGRIQLPVDAKDNWFLEKAEVAARRSKDTTQVGAALIGPEGEVRLTAFNGPPKGVEDRPERFERPMKYLYASHAEWNIIGFAARAGIVTNGCKVLVTHKTCSICARLLVQSGIKEVINGPGVTKIGEEDEKAATDVFREARVHVRVIGGTF